MTKRNILGAVLLVVAYLLLIPGVSLPVIHITSILDKAVLAEMGKESLMASKDIPAFIMPFVSSFIDSVKVSGTEIIQQSSKSLIGTAEVLWNDGNSLVAIMILLFSIVIPVLKGVLLAVSGSLSNSSKDNVVAKLAKGMSKWSMADVFVMALIISFLGANASTETSGLIQTKAEFGEGFYFFLGYCILSIASAQLMRSPTR